METREQRDTKLQKIVKAEKKARSQKSFCDLEEVRGQYFEFLTGNPNHKRDELDEEAETRMRNIDGTLSMWEDDVEEFENY